MAPADAVGGVTVAMPYCEASIHSRSGRQNVRDALAQTTESSSSSSPALFSDELSDDVLDMVVGGLTTDAALARAVAFGHAGPVPR